MKIALLALRNSIHTARWANSLAGRGHEVHLISMQPQKADIFIRPEVVQHDLSVPAPIGYFVNAWQVRRLLSRLQPNLLHAHFASGYGTLGRLSGFRPLIISAWGSDVFKFPYESALNRRILVDNLSAAARITSSSQVMADEVVKLDGRLKDRLTVIPFGIDIDRFCPQPEKRDPRYFTIGTVKTLSRIYGIDILIRAFSELCSRMEKRQGWQGKVPRLVIIGGTPPKAEDDQTAELRQLCARLGVQDKVTFTGYVDHREVPEWLNTFDIFATLSRSDSFGVAVLEASACGLPVVVSNIGGLPEVVKEAHTGFVVPCEDVEGSVAALEKLAIDATLREQMGQAGRKHVIQSYNWEDCVTAMEMLYQEMAG